MNRRRAAFPAVLVASLVPFSSAAPAQPLGAEFRVNTSTFDSQDRPDVAFGQSGGFVVVWQDHYGSVPRVLGRRFDATGAPAGSEFRVDTTTTGLSGTPRIAAGAAGEFLVVWDLTSGDGSGLAVFARRLSADGVPLAGQLRVNTDTTGSQMQPSVTSDSQGNLVVVWKSSNYPFPPEGIFGRRFGPQGAPAGTEFRVTAASRNYASAPEAAAFPLGGFVVVWASDYLDGSGTGVYGRAFSGPGAPLGSEFRVNTTTTGDQYRPVVAADTTGSFAVIWTSKGQDGSGAGLYGQRFSGAGAPVGPEFRVNSYTSYSQTYPAVIADAWGDIVVTWSSTNLDGFGSGVFGRRFSRQGVPLGLEFRVNTYTTYDQWRATAAAEPGGRYVVTWESLAAGRPAIHGQRFRPMGLGGDANGDGTVNVSDVLYLINFLFAGGPPPAGPADVDGNNAVNVSDVLYLINFLFAGGPAPA